jgi:hypothetical protein
MSIELTLIREILLHVQSRALPGGGRDSARSPAAAAHFALAS